MNVKFPMVFRSVRSKTQKMVRKSMLLITLILLHAYFHDVGFGFNVDNCINFKCRLCGIRLIHALNVTCNGCFSSLGVLHHTDVKREVRTRKDSIYEIFANRGDEILSNSDRVFDDEENEEDSRKLFDQRSLDLAPKILPSSVSRRRRVTECCRKGCTVSDLRKYCYQGCWWLKSSTPVGDRREEHSEHDEDMVDFPALNQQ